MEFSIESTEYFIICILYILYINKNFYVYVCIHNTNIQSFSWRTSTTFTGIPLLIPKKCLGSIGYMVNRITCLCISPLYFDFCPLCQYSIHFLISYIMLWNYACCLAFLTMEFVFLIFLVLGQFF